MAGGQTARPETGQTMRRVLPKNGLMVLDAGNAGKHMRVYYDTYEPGTFMSIDDWASVGAAFPIAMGAKMARPECPVLVTVGDWEDHYSQLAIYLRLNGHLPPTAKRGT